MQSKKKEKSEAMIRKLDWLPNLDYYLYKTRKRRLIMENRPLFSQIQSIESGLPFTDFDKIRCALELSQKKMGKIVGIGHSTLAQRKKSGRLSKNESERVDRISRIFCRAKEVFEDKDIAKKWLNEPLEYFQGKTPLHFTSTEIGGREVEDLLGRIEHGVFS
ncbi:MAG: antitoxin Xre/MbcA/ParS toxin-binding domain-containing protein [Desulfobacteraceae bacterium]